MWLLDFEHPAYVGMGVFLALVAFSLIWRWIRWDDSDHHRSKSDR
jgi:hypothetical protein